MKVEASMNIKIKGLQSTNLQLVKVTQSSPAGNAPPSKMQNIRVDVKNMEARLKQVATLIKSQIVQNILLARSWKQQPLKALSPRTVAMKTFKGRAEPSRVMYDSGKLAQSVIVKKEGGQYVVTFKDWKYPKYVRTNPRSGSKRVTAASVSKKFGIGKAPTSSSPPTVKEVAYWQNKGFVTSTGIRVPSRPFFGITQGQLDKIVKSVFGTYKKPKQKQTYLDSLR